MSPTLSSMYLEALIERLRKSSKRMEIGGKRLGCLVYADDDVLMA